MKQNKNDEALVEKVKTYYADVKPLIEQCVKGRIHEHYGLVYSTQEILIRELYGKLGEVLTAIQPNPHPDNSGLVAEIKQVQAHYIQHSSLLPVAVTKEGNIDIGKLLNKCKAALTATTTEE